MGNMVARTTLGEGTERERRESSAGKKKKTTYLLLSSICVPIQFRAFDYRLDLLLVAWKILS
jgi:hypothetical protein